MMKALSVLKRDPASKLKTARTLLAAAEARFASLKRERDTALVESDDIETLRRLDREIEEQGRAIVTIHDRIMALAAERRRQDYALRVREQQEAIDKFVATAVAEYVQHGHELQKAFLHFLDLYDQLEGKRTAVYAVWPAAAPRPNSDLWVSHRTNPFNGHVSNIRHSAKEIAERIAANGASFIANCRKVVIPMPLPDDDNQTEQDEAA
jgi:hypothetical protein